MSRAARLAVLFLSAAAATAGAQSYVVRSGTSTFSPLSGGTAFAFQKTSTYDALDEGTQIVSLPFSFSFFGAAFTSVSINTNGILLFSADCAPASGDKCMAAETWGSSAAPNNYLAFWWDDSEVSTDTGNRYAITATAPNRVLTIQFAGWHAYSTASNPRSVQVQLFEGSNRVRVNYGPINRNDANATTTGAVAVQDAGASTTLQGLACKGSCTVRHWLPNTFVEFVPVTAAPALVVSPGPNLFFGTVAVGSSGTPTSVTVANNGASTVTLNAISLAGGNAADFPLSSLPSPMPYALAAAASVTFQVGFSPTAAGDRASTLKIDSTDSVASRELLVGGSGAAASSSVTPTSLAFANQRVNTTSFSKTVSVKNTGDLNITVQSATLSGANAADFSLYTGTLPATVYPGNSKSIYVYFRPSAAGPRTATLTVVDSIGSKTVALSGTGVVPVAGVNPTSIDFGSQSVGTAGLPKPISVINSGTDTLAITSIALGGTNPSQFVLTGLPALPAYVAVGQSTAFNVFFQPSVAGALAATVTVATDDPARPTLSVPLAGRGANPTIAVSPASIAFGDVRVNTTSANIGLTIQNTSTDPLTVSSVGFGGPQASELGVSGIALPSVVPGGGSVTAQITLRPAALGPRSAEVRIGSNATNAPALAVPVTATGVGPQASISPASVAFGDVPVGSSSTAQAVTVSNTGTAPLIVNGASIAGPNAAEFSYAGLALPATVAAGGSFPFQVRGTPAAAGPRSATLTIATDDKPLSVGLSMNGLAPTLSLSLASADLGSQRVGTASGATPLVLRNAGGATLILSGLAIGGANPSDFTASGVALPVSLLAGQAATVELRFKPTAIGARSAALTVSSNDPASPSATVQLSGTGLGPQVALSATSFSFGRVQVSAAASPQPLTLTNTGNAALKIASIGVAGPQAAVFTVTGTPAELPIAVSPGLSLTVEVGFRPATVGSAAAKLAMVTDQPGTPNIELPLDGEGIAATVEMGPATLDFGAVKVGADSAARTVSVRNIGTAALNVTAVSLAGADAASFRIDNPPFVPYALAPASRLEVAVVFRPGAIGARSATLAIGTDAPGAGSLAASLAGAGVSGAANVSPASLDFGVVRRGTRTMRPVVVRNTGGTPIRLGAPAVAGPGAGSYAVAVVGSLDPLAAGQEATIQIAFQPTAVGSFPATLGARSPDFSASALAVPLAGSAAEAGLAVEPSLIDFGSVAPGLSSEPRSIGVRNTGGMDLTVRAFASDNPEFALDTSALPAVIAAGQSAKATVTFRPNGEGSRHAVLKLEMAELDYLAAIAVTGRGDAEVSPRAGCGCGAGGSALPLAALAAIAAARRRRRAP